MKEWKINSTTPITLLIDRLTLLKGSFTEWSDIVKAIEQTFNSNKYEIYESNEKINVGDFCLSFLSFSDDYLTMDSSNTKKKLMQLFNAYLELSPFYKNIVEGWEELQEEVELLSEELGYSSNIVLEDYGKYIVENHLKWESNKEDPLKEVFQQIKLTKKSIPDKRHLFIIISPENNFSASELNKLETFLKSQTGYCILISEYMFNGSINIIHNNQIINRSSVLDNKKLINDILPFVFDENTFEKSIKWYIEAVDNCTQNIVKLRISSVDNLEEFIYVFLMIYVTHISFLIDYTGIPNEYKKFIESIIEYGV